MHNYQIFVSFHVVFAGMWLIFFAADFILKRQIENAGEESVKNKFISLYLQFTNLFGIVGAVGIAITGIILVLTNPGYGFFDMSHAHWLATKQIIFVIILLNTFLRTIPASKKLRNFIHQKDEENIEKQFEIIKKINMLINILVFLNFIFAITHRFYS